ncbi:hypothetical protein ACLB2K_053104 [Fragaria x ananassa]
MASAAETSETLLSKLESADSAGTHRLISDYLNPFADLHNKRKKKTSADLQTLQRSLAKTFTPFLNLALAILADPSNLDADSPPPPPPPNCSTFTASASTPWTPCRRNSPASRTSSTSRGSGVEQGGADKEFGALIGEVVYILARVLDETASDKVHRQLAIYLGRCTLFLVEELSSFGQNLVCKFCCITVSEYAKSPIKDHMFQWGRRIC